MYVFGDSTFMGCVLPNIDPGSGTSLGRFPDVVHSLLGGKSAISGARIEAYEVSHVS